MKRFVTYLYEYNQGKKIKNTGFVRIDVRGDVVNMEVFVKNAIRTEEVGNIYAIVHKQECLAVNIGEIVLKNGECSNRLSFSRSHIAGSSYTLNDMIGLAVCFENTGYLASCWKDEYADKIASGEFSPYVNEEVKDEQKPEDVIQVAEEMIEVGVNQPEIVETFPSERRTTYRKIQADQIRDLPSSNWHLSENSFLKHGIFNYGFLFLKKETYGDEEKLWLGVPGYYEKQELLMALLFGFAEFEPVPKEAVDIEMNMEKLLQNIEKNQEPKTGIFGGWFVLLDK